MVGASGALFGILAGFALLFPNTELMLLFPPIPIKAKYLIGAYLLFEIYMSFSAVNSDVAHLAHVGGAIVGIIIVLIWRKRDRSNFW
jgi:membrane associated rhomboid family serine protease